MVMEKYFVPKTIEEACFLLSSNRAESVIVAGGTDLVVRMKQGIVQSKCVINIGSIAGQNYINYDENKGLKIGAQASIHSLATSPVIRTNYSILAQAAHELGTPQIRR